MTDNTRTWLHDILSRIDEVESYFNTNPKNFDHFVSNPMLRKAIERNLEIIGEAMSRILKDDSTVQISDSRKIVDLRNRVIHGYDVVDPENIWSIVINHLPKLKVQVQQLINS